MLPCRPSTQIPPVQEHRRVFRIAAARRPGDGGHGRWLPTILIAAVCGGLVPAAARAQAPAAGDGTGGLDLTLADVAEREPYPDLLGGTLSAQGDLEEDSAKPTGRFRRDTGMALVLISHDLGVVGETCERVCVLYAGRVNEEAATERLLKEAIAVSAVSFGLHSGL